jgi:hypothetical protein
MIRNGNPVKMAISKEFIPEVPVPCDPGKFSKKIAIGFHPPPFYMISKILLLV